MTSAHSILRSLITYAVCIPLAVFLGYLMTNPLDIGTFITLALILAVLCGPLLIRFHHPLMLFFWNTTAVLFFLPGRPWVWMGTVTVSFMISMTQRILNKEVRAISVPELTRPLMAIVVVALVTAKLTGGIGLRAFGGDVYGGRKYLTLFAAILGFFALAANRIPRERARLSIGLYFLGGATVVIGDLFPVLGSALPFLFWLIPPYSLSSSEIEIGLTRLGGLTAVSSCIFSFMLARYGVQGIFTATRPWRFLAFIFFSGCGFFGGFRSLVIGYFGIFMLQFFLEGLHRTKLFPLMLLGLTLVGAAAVPFASKLPPTVQRALAFLPLPIDPVVSQSAQASSEWRLQMWKAVLPQVPQYLLLGKGLALSHQDWGDMGFGDKAISEDQWGAALAGDYHSGPLSVLIPFGIWGLIAFTWFLAAGLRVLYKNYRYGDPALRTINTFLLASFVVHVAMFWIIVGGFTSDMLQFVGVLGLSVGLNNGVARQAVQAIEKREPQARELATVLPRQRPVFGGRSG